jgi:nuclear transcription Y subunit beta
MSDDHLGMDSPGSPGSEGPNLLREQDRYLPIANISRIMKKALPANAKIAKDAKETVQECVSEFTSFITSEYVPASCVLSPPHCASHCCRCYRRASDKCQSEKRKTINGDDILSAMVTLGFDNYVEPLKLYLHKYREVRLLLSVLRRKAIGQPPTSSLTFHRPSRSFSLSEHTDQEAAQEGRRVS